MFFFIVILILIFSRVYQIRLDYIFPAVPVYSSTLKVHLVDFKRSKCVNRRLNVSVRFPIKRSKCQQHRQQRVKSIGILNKQTDAFANMEYRLYSFKRPRRWKRSCDISNIFEINERPLTGFVWRNVLNSNMIRLFVLPLLRTDMRSAVWE